MSEFTTKFGPTDEDVPLGAGCDPSQAITQPRRESSVVVLPRADYDIIENSSGVVIEARLKGLPAEVLHPRSVNPEGLSEPRT